MKKANHTRIVENNLSEHIRQENEAYREIIRKRRENDEAKREQPPAGPDLVCWEHQAGREPIRLSFSIKVF
jgi:hypothetical protein